MTYWVVMKYEHGVVWYVSDVDESGSPILTIEREKAYKFYDFGYAMTFFDKGYAVQKKYG